MLPSDAGGSRQMSSASIGTVASTLNAIEVDPETVRQIVELLKVSQHDIGDTQFDVVQPADFGASAVGHLLGHHQVLAHQVVKEAMDDMLKDLGKNQVNVTRYVESQEFNEFESAHQQQQIKDLLESLPFIGPLFGKGAN